MEKKMRRIRDPNTLPETPMADGTTAGEFALQQVRRRLCKQKKHVQYDKMEQTTMSPATQPAPAGTNSRRAPAPSDSRLPKTRRVELKAEPTAPTREIQDTEVLAKDVEESCARSVSKNMLNPAVTSCD